MSSALEQLTRALAAVEKKEVDPRSLSWTDLEKGLVKLLGGPFRIDRPDHQAIALGVSGLFGEKLSQEFGAFWFLNRDSVEGVAIGFPEALLMLSPFGAVVDALGRARLEGLDDTIKEIRRQVGAAKFSASAQQPMRLQPDDYQRLFDPGFIQFVILDPSRVQSVFAMSPDKIIREVRDALGRTDAQFPKEARQQFESQILMALRGLQPDKPLADQVERAPRVAELMTHLFATVSATGAAPEEFWAEVAFPVLHIGAPAQFPPLDEEELEAFKQGADPVALFLDTVPHQFPAVEEGVLGAFPVEEVGVPHPSMARVPGVRLLKLGREKIRAPLDAFDGQKLKTSVEAFAKHVEGLAGKPATRSAEGSQILDVSLALLTDLKRVAGSQGEKGELCVRRVTEAEAASDPAIGFVRKALHGPRIILAP